jgi:hypothetical protein
MAFGSDLGLVELGKDRFGVITDREAIEAGLSRRQIEWRLRTGLFYRAAPGVLVVGAAPSTWEQQVAISVFGAGTAAVASHRTAAVLWGLLRTSGGTIEISVRRWERTHRHHLIHESTDLSPADCTLHRGIPVTTPARTIVDLGAVFASSVPEVFQKARRAGLVDLVMVEEVVRRVGRRGRSGTGAARQLIREVRRHPHRTESVAEDMYIDLCRRAGLPEPGAQIDIYDEQGWFICRADFGYTDPRLCIFIDGYAFHSEEEPFQKDRTQQNRLSLAGWEFLRFTYADLRDRPSYVVNQVREILSNLRRSSEPPGAVRTQERGG